MRETPVKMGFAGDPGHSIPVFWFNSHGSEQVKDAVQPRMIDGIGGLGVDAAARYRAEFKAARTLGDPTG